MWKNAFSSIIHPLKQKNSRISKCLTVLLPAIFCFVFVVGSLRSEEADPAKRARLEIRVMQQWYDKNSGLWWGKMGWWNSANALTTIIRYSKFTGDRRSFPMIEHTFQQARRFHDKNFINEFYDDGGWWGLAWVEAYELTGKQEYLDMAVFIFDDMTGGWSNEFGGGIYWKKNNPYKASIANNLFSLLGLRRHANGVKKKIRDHTPLEWARRDWQWFSKTGLILSDVWQVGDGVAPEGLRKNAHWTYNQGLAVAVLVELYKVDKDKEKLNMAEKIAKATMKRSSHNGILREFIEPKIGGDGAQFKGVFVRHLYTLYAATRRREYRDFIVANGDAVWERRNQKTGVMRAIWCEPSGDSEGEPIGNAHRSALDAIVSQIGAQKIKPSR